MAAFVAVFEFHCPTPLGRRLVAWDDGQPPNSCYWTLIIVTPRILRSSSIGVER
jgi:hypothetical protein